MHAGDRTGSGAGGRMNLIICSLDTLRADHLSCLGNGRGLTPNLDRIASEGALFSQTYATDIPTQPSHTALFTGKFGINSGIVSHFHPAAYLPEETLWLPSELRRNGYVTGAVDHLFAMKDWFIRGYDDYMPPPGRSCSPGSVINGIGLPWVSEHKERDFFLFLHFWDAHIPYVPPSPFKERYSHGTAGPHRPGHHRQARGSAELPAVQAEPLRLPRRHAEPRLHRRPVRRRGGLPRLRDRADLPAPRERGPARGHHGRPVRRPRREHDRARRLVRPRRPLRLGHPRAPGDVGARAGSRPWSRRPWSP